MRFHKSLWHHECRVSLGNTIVSWDINQVNNKRTEDISQKSDWWSAALTDHGSNGADAARWWGLRWHRWGCAGTARVPVGLVGRGGLGQRLVLGRLQAESTSSERDTTWTHAVRRWNTTRIISSTSFVNTIDSTLIPCSWCLFYVNYFSKVTRNYIGLSKNMFSAQLTIYKLMNKLV